MKKLKHIFFRLIIAVAGLYILVIIILYFIQEKLLFHPEVLAQEYAFAFRGSYQEIFIPVNKDVKLHGVLFKAEKPKGLVFYLHGNGGSVNGWGNAAETYTTAGYNVFMLDYRGYGKSSGHIESEDQINSDVEKAYIYMMKNYGVANVIIAGYSIGTGPATQLAAKMKCKALLLQAPYYSLTELVDEKVPLLPGFVKRYKFETYKFIDKVSAPVYIFHGTDDKLIPFSNAEKLMKHSKKGDKLIALPEQGHNAINDSELYREELKKILD